jgi:hypothetical protein
VKLRPHAPELVIVAAALAVAIGFAAVTIGHNGRLGLPLDDAYIYLTYAKQFGRAEPFTYFPGGGYSAGSTSILWPMTLAPFWTLGARGHALVWVSFTLCTALYAWTCVGIYWLAQRIAGRAVGVFAAGLAIATAPFAFTALAGMEVGLAAALLVAALLLLYDAPATGRPTKRLVACLAALSLSRPEAALIVAGIVGLAVLARLRQRDYRAAAWWIAPLMPLALWMLANRAFAGNLMPNTGVAKSHFYQPAFDWSYWWSAFTGQTKNALVALFWEDKSPFQWPKLFAIAWLVGAVRIVLWSKRERKLLVGALIVGSPLLLVVAVNASSGTWDLHDYRYIAAGFPLFALTAACAFAPPRAWARPWGPRAHVGGVAVIGALYAYVSIGPLRAEGRLYAQNAVDLERQVVTLGRYIHDQLPEARIMLHDAGAIAYYGDSYVYDMLGLVTNHQARVANNGPGARFEFLERMPAERRPTHFAYYPAWMGHNEMYGTIVLQTPLGRQFAERRLVGGGDMMLIEANWDHVHTGERPLAPHPTWRIVDRVDVADIEDEQAHRWSGALGPRRYGDRTARYSVVHREANRELGLVVDGGRTIRGREERFTVTIDPAKPARLILRTGGEREYGFNEAITQPATLKITTTKTVTAKAPVPDGHLVDLEVELPHGTAAEVTVEVAATAPYRSFHWFVLQPDAAF